MYCAYIGRECNSSIECQYCPIFNNNSIPVPGTACNYKCPHCGGEFNTPGQYKGYSTSAIQFVCPFCGVQMKGL